MFFKSSRFKSIALCLTFLGVTNALTFEIAQAVPTRAEREALDNEAQSSPTLNRILLALMPSVDTSLPETAREASQRIQELLANGHALEALAAIDDYETLHPQRNEYARNVQMLFLRGRAYIALNRIQSAQAIYEQLTGDYPEFPEAWNNLASIYLYQGQARAARDALFMATRVDPSYKLAQKNLENLDAVLQSPSQIFKLVNTNDEDTN